MMCLALCDIGGHRSQCLQHPQSSEVVWGEECQRRWACFEARGTERGWAIRENPGAPTAPEPHLSNAQAALEQPSSNVRAAIEPTSLCEATPPDPDPATPATPRLHTFPFAQTTAPRWEAPRGPASRSGRIPRSPACRDAHRLPCRPLLTAYGLVYPSGRRRNNGGEGPRAQRGAYIARQAADGLTRPALQRRGPWRPNWPQHTMLPSRPEAERREGGRRAGRPPCNRTRATALRNRFASCRLRVLCTSSPWATTAPWIAMSSGGNHDWPTATPCKTLNEGPPRSRQNGPPAVPTWTPSSKHGLSINICNSPMPMCKKSGSEPAHGHGTGTRPHAKSAGR